MRYLLRFLHILEMLIVLPVFIVCVSIYFFSKNQTKAERIVNWWIKYLKWIVSIFFWVTLYLFL